MRKQALTLSAAALAMVGIAGAATAHNHRDGHHSPDANGDGLDLTRSTDLRVGKQIGDQAAHPLGRSVDKGKILSGFVV